MKRRRTIRCFLDDNKGKTWRGLFSGNLVADKE